MHTMDFDYVVMHSDTELQYFRFRIACSTELFGYCIMVYCIIVYVRGWVQFLNIRAVSSGTYRYCLLSHSHLGHCLWCHA